MTKAEFKEMLIHNQNHQRSLRIAAAMMEKSRDTWAKLEKLNMKPPVPLATDNG